MTKMTPMRTSNELLYMSLYIPLQNSDQNSNLQ